MEGSWNCPSLTLVTDHRAQLLTAWELSVRAACSLHTTVPTLPRCGTLITFTLAIILYHSCNNFQ